MGDSATVQTTRFYGHQAWAPFQRLPPTQLLPPPPPPPPPLQPSQQQQRQWRGRPESPTGPTCAKITRTRSPEGQKMTLGGPPFSLAAAVHRTGDNSEGEEGCGYFSPRDAPRLVGSSYETDPGRAGDFRTFAPGYHGRPAPQHSERLVLAKCCVCELAASGNNFGVATCESCKTFFRRNAKREASQIKCLHQNSCNVLREYRRSCTACRLRKCFAVGMKKDLILSDEKLRTRARPTFKKPRFRWCRVPADLNVDHLLSGVLPTWAYRSESPDTDAGGPSLPPPLRTLPRQQQLMQQQPRPLPPPLSPKNFPADGHEGSSTSDMDDSRACSLTEVESLAHNFELSLVYQQLMLGVKNYRMPHGAKLGPCAPVTARLFHCEESFTSLESSVRRLIRLIPQLPGFESMEKELLGRIVKFKVFGGIQLTSALSYDYLRDAWVMPESDCSDGCCDGTDGAAEVVLPLREATMATFTSLMSRRCVDGRPLYTPADVERIYATLHTYYRELRDLFGDQRPVAAIILLGLYLLEDDVGLDLRSEERALVKATQWHYMQYLDGLANMQEAAAAAANYKAKRALLLLLPIRWLDVRYSDGSSAMQITRTPPVDH